MMDQNAGAQQKIMCVTMESLMPEKHFLRDLDRLVDFSFVYDKVKNLYSHTGRRSVDPVIIVKMMLLGYIYGINSERKLEQEVRVNIAYRWFLGIDLDSPVPDHTTFSQLRRRKFNNTELFEEIFTEIVRCCIDLGLIDGKLLLTDSTHVRANARNDLYETVTVEVEPSRYIQRLNEEAKAEGIYPKPERQRNSKKDDNDKNNTGSASGGDTANDNTVHASDAPSLAEKREIAVNKTDPESGYMNRPGKPKGFYYLDHQTCDGKNGLITDVFVTSGNVNDCTVHADRIKYQIDKFGFQTEGVCADKAYDVSEIHRDMLERGIRTFIPPKDPRNNDNGLFPTNDFRYDQEENTYTCPNGQVLTFSNYMPKSATMCYSCKRSICKNCTMRTQCISDKTSFRKVYRAHDLWASEEQHEKNDFTVKYYEALRKRQIWCEGNFSHQKANHNLSRVRTRGLKKATMHCLLSATALNLKRMVMLLKRRPALTSASYSYFYTHIYLNFALKTASFSRLFSFLSAFVNSTIFPCYL